jgi:acetyl-CoA C-acetyltransferase
MLMTHQQAKNLNLTPLVKIKGFASYAQAPEWFTTAPAHCIKKLLKMLDWQIQDIDLWEINEAFAVVTLAAIQELKLDPEKVNIHGGACALGHPIGASGARIVVSLIYAMLKEHKSRGIASICIGGGEALAIALER